MLVAATRCRDAHGDGNPTSWAIHKTEDGLIISCVATRVRSKTWGARISGPGIETGTTTRSLEEARAYLLDSVHRLFPQHRCTERCETYGMAALVAVHAGRAIAKS